MKKQTSEEKREWHHNYVKAQREETLQRLQDHFNHVEAFNDDVMASEYETYVIFTYTLDHFDMEFLKRNLLEIKFVSAKETNRLTVVVTREGTQK